MYRSSTTGGPGSPMASSVRPRVEDAAAPPPAFALGAHAAYAKDTDLRLVAAAPPLAAYGAAAAWCAYADEDER